jgi:formylglycine-generating enzyme required for sulfatase activity
MKHNPLVQFLAKFILFVLPCGALSQTTTTLDVHLYSGLTITGSVGKVYKVEYTPKIADTNSWTQLSTLTLPFSPYLFVDTSTPVASSRFYRATMLTNVPPANPYPTRLVWIPPGTFTMGSASNEAGHRSDEIQHTVTLTRGFYMSKYLITQADPSSFSVNSGLPVRVSWFDATNFCSVLTQQEANAGRLPPDFRYRLPTEAEWEYACRAGTTTRFSFGDDPTLTVIGAYVWYSGNSGGFSQTVGTKGPNPWGLYDMTGNADWQWCSDWYGSYPAGAVTDPTGPLLGTDTTPRVLRGGSFASFALSCRSAGDRGANSPSYSGRGFRVVLGPN